MRDNRLYFLWTSTGAVLLGGCVPVQQLQSVAAAGGALANSMTNSIGGTGEPVALSAVELRQLQSRDFATTKAAAFASTMTVLLDSGYRVQSADLESGLITATASSSARLRLDTTGLSRASQTPVATAYIEDRGQGAARVRVVFSLGTSASGPLAPAGERAVLDRAVYTGFFAQLAQEIELRPAPRQPVAEPVIRTAEPVKHKDVAGADMALPQPIPELGPEPELEPELEQSEEGRTEAGGPP